MITALIVLYAIGYVFCFGMWMSAGTKRGADNIAELSFWVAVLALIWPILIVYSAGEVFGDSAEKQ